MKFYTKLALTNIKNNRQIYIPYLITCIFTVSLHYIISFLCFNKGLEGHETISTFMAMGKFVIVVFSFIFLLYTNSFIIKRRKKEIGIYNVLGMEKKHIMIMMFIETFVLALTSLVLGLLLGIVLSKLMFMILTYLMHISSHFVFEIPMISVVQTLITFSIIFFISLLFNIVQVKVSNPIELMKGGNVGEKEPKTKLIMTLIGFITLGAGYYIAVTIEDPMTAIVIFFVAVLLVMMGTYCLFTAGSITILKLLKKNKRFYYQTKHFTSVSGMIYRMKQNAVGLANICILCTCVLVTLSSTICLYVGIEDTVKKQCPSDFYFVSGIEESDRILNDVKKAVEYTNLPYDELYQLDYYSFLGYREENEHVIELDQNKVKRIRYYNVHSVNIISETNYNRAYHKNVDVTGNNALFYNDFDYPFNDITFNDFTFVKSGTFQEKEVMLNNAFVPKNIALIVSDEAYQQVVQSKQLENYGKEGSGVIIESEEASSKQFEDMYSHLTSLTKNYSSHNHGIQKMLMEVYLESYGGLLFIGIFLSIMFMMAAILIIYYKQLTEGYEDQKRFEILQNVGMSQKEVKQTIRSQVLIFFFLPLVVAIIHTLFAYPLMTNVLNAFLLGKANTYIFCISGCMIGLILIYSIVYLLTAKIYYQIVKH